MKACRALLIAAWLGAAASPQEFPGKDWVASPPAAEGFDTAALQEAVQYLEKRAGKDGVTQLAIVRNGRLVWAGPRIDAVHGVWSMTKSFTSTVLGLLIDDDKATLDTPAARYVPALAARYPAVALRHFATMTSGYRAAGDEPRGAYRHGPSQTPFIPGEPMFSPGAHFLYWDSAMNQFANVLTRIAGEPLDAVFRRRIAEPIGMNPAQWEWGDWGVVDGIRVNNGAGNYGMMKISAREAARFGLLFLHRGEWAGRRLISRNWVRRATANQVRAATMPGGPVPGTGVYGYNWWVNGQPDGERKWPGAPEGTFSASGYNNNDLFVIPKWNMVVVRLGLDEQDTQISDETYGEFMRLIGESLKRRR